MNEEEYKRALSQIEKLMDAERGTEELVELVRLTALVEEHENINYPFPTPE